MTEGNKRIGKGNHGKNQHTKGDLQDVARATFEEPDDKRFDEEVSALTGKSASAIRHDIAQAKRLNEAVGEEAAKAIAQTKLGGSREGVNAIAIRPHSRARQVRASWTHDEASDKRTTL